MKKELKINFLAEEDNLTPNSFSIKLPPSAKRMEDKFLKCLPKT